MKVSKMNTILVGIIENSIFIVIMVILGSSVFKPYQHVVDQYESFYVAFQFLFVPFLNLLLRNYKAVLGSFLGMFVGPLVFMLIAMLFGYRG